MGGLTGETQLGGAFSNTLSRALVDREAESGLPVEGCAPEGVETEVIPLDWLAKFDRESTFKLCTEFEPEKSESPTTCITASTDRDMSDDRAFS